MDLNMPVMDGFEATTIILKLLKEAGWMKDSVKIVAVTAYVNEEFVSRCYEVGMTDVVHKPVGREELRRIVEKYYKAWENEY